MMMQALCRRGSLGGLGVAGSVVGHRAGSPSLVAEGLTTNNPLRIFFTKRLHFSVFKPTRDLIKSRNAANTLTRFSTKAKSDNHVAEVVSLPPAPIRIALVGCTVGLASPVFIVGGIIQMWFLYLPRTTTGRMIKYAVGFIVGGGVIQAINHYIGPFLLYNSNFVLPFAVSNAVAASFWYGVAEATVGLSAISGSILPQTVTSTVAPSVAGSVGRAASSFTIPLAGPVIGALTAITVPFLWPYAFQYLWKEDYRHLILDNDPAWISHLYEWIVVPVGIPTGLLSGLLMHIVLNPFIVGAPGVPWTTRTLPALGVVTAGAALYFTLFTQPDHEIYWQEKVNPKTDQRFSYNLKTKEVLLDDGVKAREAEVKVNTIRFITTISKMSLFRDKFNQKELQSDRSVVVEEEIKTLTLERLYQYKRFHSLLDWFIRNKYLSLGSKAASSTAQGNNSPGPIAQERIDQFFHHIDVLIITKRRINAAQQELTANAQTISTERSAELKRIVREESALLQEVETVVLREDLKDNASTDDLKLLLSNLSFVENALFKEIGYRVAEKNGTEIVKVYKQNKVWEKVKNVVAAVAGLAAIIAVGVVAVSNSK